MPTSHSHDEHHNLNSTTRTALDALLHYHPHTSASSCSHHRFIVRIALFRMHCWGLRSWTFIYACCTGWLWSWGHADPEVTPYTSAIGLFCSYPKSDSNVQNFVNTFYFQQRKWELTKNRVQYDPEKLYFAVCGGSGTGNSSLVNAFHCLKNNSLTGIVETTIAITQFRSFEMEDRLEVIIIDLSQR